uniref:Fatty acid desaturase domain-containing protein n=1 Tax=Amphimedon queenslandica TaxID=400682 RepID=A0A1X7TBC6_AMPQE
MKILLVTQILLYIASSGVLSPKDIFFRNHLNCVSGQNNNPTGLYPPTQAWQGLFDPNPYFLFLMTGIGILFEGAGIALLWLFPASWTAWIIAVVCIFISGAHMQEVGHDLGHYSCFKNLKYNYWAQNITFTFLGGQSSSFWNKRHNEHHSKPSVISKDPDVTFPGNVILLGNDMPKDVGRKGKGMLPYQYQHIYLTIVCGSVWGAVAVYFAAKILQGLWLSILTQSHHLHLGVSAQDKHQDWFSYQVEHCFNFTPNWFINWATAYTNYHIEHHLFPTMPVENHHLAAPYIKELCKKHGLEYREISWAEAIAKVPRELQRPGEIWLEEYKNI